MELAECCHHQGEAKVLKLELECAKVGAAALREKAEYIDNGGHSADDQNNQKLNNMTKSYGRYLQAVQALQAAGAPRSISWSFGTLMAANDRQILDAVESACQDKYRDVDEHCRAVRELLEPAKDWKAKLPSECTIDEVIAAADPTLMTVKGKRLQDRAAMLKKAGEFADKRYSPRPCQL